MHGARWLTGSWRLTAALFDVVVTTKNSALTLGVCLKALRSSDIPVKDIFIIDKISMDGTREIAEKYGCHYLGVQLNRAESLRLGAELCSTPYFINLDSDIIIPRNFYRTLEPYVEKNFITKGIYINILPPKDRKIAERDLYWITHHIGSFDCCIIHRETFLKLSSDWGRRRLDAGEDTDIYYKCERLKIPVHQDNRVVSRHYVHSVLRILKQTRWYGKSARCGNIPGRFVKTKPQLLPAEMLLFPVMGLVEAVKWHDPKLIGYECGKMLFWFWGYLFKQ